MKLPFNIHPLSSVPSSSEQRSSTKQRYCFCSWWLVTPSSYSRCVFNTATSNKDLHLHADKRKTLEGTHVNSLSSSYLGYCPLHCLQGSLQANRKRFQIEWPDVNQEVYIGAPCDMFYDPRLEDVASYSQQAMKEQQVQADYTKFLSLSCFFLGEGGWPAGWVSAPRPNTSRTVDREGIVCIKGFLRAGLVPLSHCQGILCCQITLFLFVALTYIRFWNKILH